MPFKIALLSNTAKELFGFALVLIEKSTAQIAIEVTMLLLSRVVILVLCDRLIRFEIDQSNNFSFAFSKPII